MSVILETRRLVLRPFRETDFDDFSRICSDPEVMRYIGVGNPLSREEAWRSIALILGHWQLRGYGMLAVEEKESGSFVGRVGLYNPEGWPALEVGWLIDRARWGQGLATEAGAAAMQFAFDRLRLTRLSSVIHPSNRASIRVAEKLGMTRERVVPLNGIDVVIYCRDRPQFPRTLSDQSNVR